MPLIHVLQFVGALARTQQICGKSGVLRNTVQLEATPGQHMKYSLRMMQVLRIFRRQPLRQHPLLFLRDRRKINSNGVGLGVEKRQ